MKKKTISIFSGTLLSLTMMQVMAQKTGISFSPLNVAYYANTSPMTQSFMGIGIERNVGDYISIKLEINRGFQIFYSISNGNIMTAFGNGSKEKNWTDSSGYSNYFYYHWTVPCFDINYQSKFFFRGNDKTGAYMSMGIGVRTVRYIFHVGPNKNVNNYSEDIPHEIVTKDEYSENLTVIPLFLRVGARGYMKGFYPDFSFGMGYNFARDKTIQDKTLTKWNLSVPELSGFTVTAGLSFGIGW